METWEKVTTRSRVSRTNDPMETIAAIGLKLDQDDRRTHIWKKTTLCPVTVLVDSQVSDCCPWATCFFFSFVLSPCPLGPKEIDGLLVPPGNFLASSLLIDHLITG